MEAFRLHRHHLHLQSPRAILPRLTGRTDRWGAVVFVKLKLAGVLTGERTSTILKLYLSLVGAVSLMLTVVPLRRVGLICR
jgi:hypothetical protein